MASKKVCKYGAKCYRKNTQHLAEYSHPGREEKEDDSEEKDPLPPAKRARRESPEEKKGPKKRDITSYFSKKKNESEKEKKDEKDEKEKTDEEDEKSEEEEVNDGEGKKEEAASADAEGKPKAKGEGASSVPEEAPKSTAEAKDQIKEKFLVQMPEDFYAFWELAKSINSSKPNLAFKKSLGLELVGPFDVLGGRCVRKNGSGESPCYLRHWRYYYDPPEFQTVVKGDDSTQYHMGYFRDDPAEMPVFVAANAAKKNCTITPRGENLFTAISLYIDDLIKEKKSSKSELLELKKKVRGAAEAGDYSLEVKTKAMKARDKKVNCKLFHGAGMVVPIDDNDVGYREVPETPADLKKMFKKIAEAKTDGERDAAMDPLMEIIMLIQFANDECDYGEGLELGLDMFSYGGGNAFKSTILNLLPMAYQLLGRHEYIKIIQAHMEDRQHTANLNQLE